MNDLLNKAVFLDRDGVLNRPVIMDGKPYPPANIQEFEILADVPEAMKRLKSRGYLLICVTNQPDVARGTQKRENIEAMHEILQSSLPLDAIEVCYEDGDDCPMRKPNPGMILAAGHRLGVDLDVSFMVGDRWRDVEAGRLAGCCSVFIDHGYQESLKSRPAATVHNLLEAAEWILTQ